MVQVCFQSGVTTVGTRSGPVSSNTVRLLCVSTQGTTWRNRSICGPLFSHSVRLFRPTSQERRYTACSLVFLIRSWAFGMVERPCIRGSHLPNIFRQDTERRTVCCRGDQMRPVRRDVSVRDSRPISVHLDVRGAVPLAVRLAVRHGLRATEEFRAQIAGGRETRPPGPSGGRRASPRLITVRGALRLEAA